MRKNHDEVPEVLNEYPEMLKQFTDLVSTGSEGFRALKGVLLKKLDERQYRFEALGETLILRFRAVFADRHIPLGEISVLLVENEGTHREEVNSIHTRWFDSLGNILKDPTTNQSTVHTRDASYLMHFLAESIAILIERKTVTSSD